MADFGATVDIFEAAVTVEPGTGTPYVNVRIPAVTRTPAGTLIAFAEGRDGTTDFGNIDIIARRSTDGGATWGSVFKVKENGTNTAGNPAPVINGAGDVVLLYIRQDASGGTNRFPMVTKSTDDGVTWSTSTDLSSLKPSGWTWIATGPGHGIRTSQGRLIVPINGNHATSGYHAGCLYSDDDGTTWNISSTLSDNSGVNNYNESTIAELPDGTLVMFSRNEGGSGPDRIRSTSTDGGVTWGSSGDSGMTSVNVQGSVLQHHDRLLFSSTDNASNRLGMKIRQSTNGGTSWTAHSTVWSEDSYGAGAGQAGYSDLVATGGNSVGILYERGHDVNGERYRYTTWSRVPLDGITQVGTATHAGNGFSQADTNTRTASKPTGVQAGDLLVAMVSCNSITINTPDGWTLYTSTSNSLIFTKLYYRVAGGSEPADYTFTAQSNGPFLLSIVAFRGVDTTTPFGSSPGVSNNATTTAAQSTPTYASNNITNGLMCYVRGTFVTSTTATTYTADQFVTELVDVCHSVSANGVNGSKRAHCLYTGNGNFEGTAESKAGHEVTANHSVSNNAMFTFALNSGSARETYWEYSATPIPAQASAPRSAVGALAIEMGE